MRRAAQRPRTACRGKPVANGMMASVAKVIARFVEQAGKPPSDDELAAWFAISRDRVRYHRSILKE